MLQAVCRSEFQKNYLTAADSFTSQHAVLHRYRLTTCFIYANCVYRAVLAPQCLAFLTSVIIMHGCAADDVQRRADRVFS